MAAILSWGSRVKSMLTSISDRHVDYLGQASMLWQLPIKKIMCHCIRHCIPELILKKRKKTQKKTTKADSYDASPYAKKKIINECSEGFIFVYCYISNDQYMNPE